MYILYLFIKHSGNVGVMAVNRSTKKKKKSADCDTTCSEILIDASTEQEVEGGDDVPEKQGPYVRLI